MDRAYIDFKMLNRLNDHNAFFINRTKHNLVFKRLYSNKVDKNENILFLSGNKINGYSNFHTIQR